jgi:HEAT repeat protein
VLLRQLETGDKLAQQEAIEALGIMGPAAQEAVPAIRAVENNVLLSRPARAALIAITGREPADQGYHWVPPQSPSLFNEGDPHTRWEIFVGDRPASRAILGQLPFLIRSLKADNWEERVLAAESLATLGPLARPAVDALLVALEDEWPLQQPLPPPTFGIGGYSTKPSTDYGVRGAAVKALLAIGPAAEKRLLDEGLSRLIAGVQRGSMHTRRHTARALGMLGQRAKPAIPALTAQLRHDQIEDGLYVDRTFLKALHKIGPATIPWAITLLLDERRSVQEHGLTLLAGFRSKAQSASPAVVRLLSHDDRSIRREAAETLLLIDVHAAVEHLPALLDDTEQPPTRTAELLSRIGPRARAALPALTTTMRGRNTKAALAAADAMLHIEGPAEELVAWVCHQLEAGEPHWWTAKLVMSLGPKARRVVPTLSQRLNDESDDVRLRAARLLWKVDPSEAPWLVPVLRHIVEKHRLRPENRNDFEPQWRLRQAVALLGEMGQVARAAVPGLVKVLGTEYQERGRNFNGYEIDEAVRRMGPCAKEAAPVYQRYLNLQNDYKEYAQSAHALAQVDPTSPTTVRFLTAMLWDEISDRLQALDDLARIGPPGAVAIPRLKSLIADEDEGDLIRLEAAFTLWRVSGEEPSPQLFRRALSYALRREPPLSFGESSPYGNAIRRLGQLAPQMNWASPMLVAEWNRASGEKRHHILLNLDDFRLLGKEAIPAIVELINAELQGPPHGGRGSDDYGVLDWKAMRALSRFGPEAKEAIPVLRFGILVTDDGWQLEGIEHAIAVIEGRAEQWNER